MNVCRDTSCLLLFGSMECNCDVVSNDVVGRIRNSGVHITRIGIKDIMLYWKEVFDPMMNL